MLRNPVAWVSKQIQDSRQPVMRCVQGKLITLTANETRKSAVTTSLTNKITTVIKPVWVPVYGTGSQNVLSRHHRWGAVTLLNSLSVIKYTPPSCSASFVWYVKQNRRSKCSCNEQVAYSNRLLFRFGTQTTKVQILQQLRTTLMLLTIRCHTRWRRQHSP